MNLSETFHKANDKPKYKQYYEIKNYTPCNKNTFITFDSDYFYNSEDACSFNDKLGGDFFARDTSYLTNVGISNCPITVGYYKNGMLHLSIFEFVEDDFTNLNVDNRFKSIKPLRLEFAQQIVSLVRAYGKKHHISKLSNLKFKIDYNALIHQSQYSDFKLLSSHDKKEYDRALQKVNDIPHRYIDMKLILNKEAYSSLRDNRNSISKLIKSKKGLTNKSIQNDLVKAESYLQSALFQKKHLSFQKKLEDNK